MKKKHAYRSLMSPTVIIYVVSFCFSAFHSIIIEVFEFFPVFLFFFAVVGLFSYFSGFSFTARHAQCLFNLLSRHSTLAISFTSFLFIRKTFSSLFTIVCEAIPMGLDCNGIRVPVRVWVGLDVILFCFIVRLSSAISIV